MRRSAALEKGTRQLINNVEVAFGRGARFNEDEIREAITVEIEATEQAIVAQANVRSTSKPMDIGFGVEIAAG